MDNDRGGRPRKAGPPQRRVSIGADARGQAGPAGRRHPAGQDPRSARAHGATRPDTRPANEPGRIGGGTIPMRAAGSSAERAPARPDDVLATIETLKPIAERVRADRKAMQELYSRFDAERDIRPRMFSRLHSASNSFMLCLVFARDQLLSDRWWDESAVGRESGEDRRVTTGEFLSFGRAGFLHALFVVVESSLRSILKAMDPPACEGGRSDFRHIYTYLLTSKLARPPADGVVLLDLLRLVKNSAHHNGVHQSRKGGDTVLEWRGKAYVFEDGKSVGFLTVDLILEIADAIRALLRQVAEDRSVHAIRAEIKAPD